MKNFILIVTMIFASTVSFAQITITQTDVANYFSLGSSYVNRIDTLTTSVDIGSTGNFSIDLSTLQWVDLGNTTSIDPAASGFSDYFPSANYVMHQAVPGLDSSDTYSFYNLGSDLNSLGSAAVATIEGLTVTIISKNLPAQLSTKLPLTFGTSWTTDYVDSNYIMYTGLPPFSSSAHVTTDFSVDGWGTIILPGKTIQVLRIKNDTKTTNQIIYNRSINYQYIAQNGESVSIELADTNASGSGVVNVIGIGWISVGTTDIRDDLAGATDYRLLNNYPNPFNPSTRISYYVPVESKVEISVYNLMGEKVSSVFNGINKQGLQEVNFNASGLSSGTYFYKMNAVSLDGKQNYSSTGKMLLLK